MKSKRETLHQVALATGLSFAQAARYTEGRRILKGQTEQNFLDVLHERDTSGHFTHVPRSTPATTLEN